MALRYGSEVRAPRISYADPQTELMLQNIDRAQTRHDQTMQSYRNSVNDILKNDTLHPNERNERLQRLEDNVFSSIQKFNGNVAQASDSILDTVLNERKDPFYNLDRQYTDVYKTAIKNRQDLERAGKSAFLRNASGMAISDIPSLFDESGNLRGREDFQFNYEGQLDYNAAAEKMFDNIQANISSLKPEERPSQGELNDIIAGYIRTGTIKSPNANIRRVLQQSLDAYKQTPEYDQLRRRGLEGEAMNILNRAAEERKYYQEVEKFNAIQQPRGGSGKSATLNPVNVYNRRQNAIVGTEQEAKIINSKLEKMKDSYDLDAIGLGGFTSVGGLRDKNKYDDPEFGFENGQLRLPTIKNKKSGEEFKVPLFQSSANNYVRELDSKKQNYEARMNEIISIIEENKNDPEAIQDYQLNNLREEYNNLSSTVTTINDLTESINNNQDELKEKEKQFISEHEPLINELLQSGLAADMDEIYKLVQEEELNKSVKNTVGIGSDIEGFNEAFVNRFKKHVKSGLKVYDISDEDKDNISEDTRINILEGAMDKKDSDDIMETVDENSTFQYRPDLKTVIIDNKYAVDPKDFRNFNNSYEPAFKTLELMENLNDNSNFGKQFKLPKSTALIINGEQIEIPAGAPIIPNRVEGYIDENGNKRLNKKAITKVKLPDGSIATREFNLNDLVDNILPNETVGLLNNISGADTRSQLTKDTKFKDQTLIRPLQ